MKSLLSCYIQYTIYLQYIERVTRLDGSAADCDATVPGSNPAFPQPKANSL
jgi:hypothetical protein